MTGEETKCEHEFRGDKNRYCRKCNMLEETYEALASQKVESIEKVLEMFEEIDWCGCSYCELSRKELKKRVEAL